MGAHGQHGHVRPQGEQTHAHNQHQRAYHKQAHGAQIHRHQRGAEQQHQQADGQHRSDGLMNFLFQFLEGCSLLGQQGFVGLPQLLFGFLPVQ